MGRTARIVIEVLLLAALVVLFVVILDPKQLREYLLRVTLRSILWLLMFQLAIHTVGMLQWVVLLRQSGIRTGAPGRFSGRASRAARSLPSPPRHTSAGNRSARPC